MQIKKIHHLSGIIITLFVGVHLFNHIWSIYGIEAHIQMMRILRQFYRNTFIETILLLAVMFQIYSGLKLVRGKKQKLSSFLEKLQIWSGLYLAFFLLIHVSAVLLGRYLLGLDTNFYFGAAGINSFPLNMFFIPYYGLAILSFFSHIAAIHAQKIKINILKITPTQQSCSIIIMGLFITICVFYGLTQGFRGIDLPKNYEILTGKFLLNQNSQILHSSDTTKIVGGGCEGCELMYVGMPDKITTEHTSIGWTEGKQKLILTGKVFQIDGKTPASDVIVYYWHTDDKGLYSSDSQTPARAKEHGRLRGWVKTDENGNYKIKTSRPAAYPSQDIPQHIHLSIKESDIDNEYFADLYFDDDPLYLKYKKKYGKADRTGTEILRIVLDGNIQIAEHNIILGLNIPDYPTKKHSEMQSGLNIGEDQPSFMPYHAFGPDKGTRTCPVCKYGRYHGIVYFVGNNPNWEEIKKWLKQLDKESISREKYLKAYLVYGNSMNYSKQTRQAELEKIGKELGLQKTALTFVPSFTDIESEAHLNKINPDIENTFVIYRHRTIVNKFINLKPTKDNFNKISEVLNQTKSEFFDLPEPKHD